MRRWEYAKLFGMVSNSEMNALGIEGWELVAVTTSSEARSTHHFKKELIL